MQDHYQILEIPRESTFGDIKKAYYSRAKSCHPDRHNNSAQKTEEFKLVVEAFNVLSDPLRRAAYDAERLRPADAPDHPRTTTSIMDTPADDELEELITGNTIPHGGHLATLLLDLAQTEIFILFREGKDLFYRKRYRAARACFIKATAHSPCNILYRCYLARACAVMGELWRAETEYIRAIELGNRRIPPQELRSVRQELERLRKRHRPWWSKLLGVFRAPLTERDRDTGEDMIDSLNCSLAKRKLESKQDKKMLK